MSHLFARRVQSFEFNDQPWVPAVLRDTIVETLSRTLRWGKILEGLVLPLTEFLDEVNSDDVLDLGSGAGEPARILGEAMAANGRRTRFLLSDLFPRVELWREHAQTSGGWLGYVPEAIDATRIPEQLSLGKSRVIINVLHHLPETLARGVIVDAIRADAPLFIAEGFQRNPLGFLPFAPAGMASLALGPILSRDRRLQRAFLSWLTPIALLAGTWDGIVSTLRVYTEQELLSMAHSEPRSRTFTFRHGTYSFPYGGRGTYFACIPQQPA